MIREHTRFPLQKETETAVQLLSPRQRAARREVSPDQRWDLAVRQVHRAPEVVPELPVREARDDIFGHDRYLRKYESGKYRFVPGRRLRQRKTCDSVKIEQNVLQVCFWKDYAWIKMI